MRLLKRQNMEKDSAPGDLSVVGRSQVVAEIQRLPGLAGVLDGNGCDFGVREHFCDASAQPFLHAFFRFPAEIHPAVEGAVAGEAFLDVAFEFTVRRQCEVAQLRFHGGGCRTVLSLNEERRPGIADERENTFVAPGQYTRSKKVRTHIIDLPGIPELYGHGDAVDVILIRHCFGIKRDIVPVGDKRGTRVETGLCGHRREHDVQLVRCADPDFENFRRVSNAILGEPFVKSFPLGSRYGRIINVAKIALDVANQAYDLVLITRGLCLIQV